MDFVINYWNRGADEFYGWQQKDAIGKRSYELLHTIFPKPVDEIRAQLLETDQWEGELTHTKADGNQVIVASRWSLRRDRQGKPTAILETSNDITEQTRREAEVQALNRELALQARLLDQTHDSIMFRDMNGLVTYWNRGAQELYGWSAEEAIGNVSHELLGTIFSAPLSDIEGELWQRGVWEGELKHTRADGTEVVVASRWSLSQDDRGQPIVMETNNDITERKHREIEISRLNQQLEQRAVELNASNEELEAFAYSISHDLRAPLRHMAGFAELLRKNAAASLNEKSQRYLTMILEAATRMGSLIDDLLAFSRISRAEAKTSLVDLSQIVREVVADIRQDTKERHIIWKMDSLPACYGDRSMLRLALVNLISNAVKFTRTRPQAEIEIGCTDKDRGDAALFVRDNGVGFDMKYSNKLFGVFQRLHPQEAFEGTGIGLATVQRIVHRHGGRIWAESTVDGGATFYLSLPKIIRS
jgi:PAS domain S-box-containing protein